MTMRINVDINEIEVLHQIPISNIISILGAHRFASYSPEIFCHYMSTEVVDAEYRRRHPNPSELLDVMDDEAIIDYLLNKGYNIEM